MCESALRGGRSGSKQFGPRIMAARAAIAGIQASTDMSTADDPVVVSVVIPTYQQRDRVIEAVMAVRRQVTNAAYELIVVDDGSSDGTDEALDPFLRDATGHLSYVRLNRNMGRAVARNAGVVVARGGIIAFTDSDCLPTPGWIESGLRVLSDQRLGIVQGPTRPCLDQPQPFFNHFIEIERFDGTFSTCNVFYRRDAILAVDGFDPAIEYWEDLDLGWRVQRAGWKAGFAPDVQVYHQVLTLSPRRWLAWPLHYAYMPAKTASYPEYRRFLFLGLWVHWLHALFDLALVGIVLGMLTKRRFLALGLPYLIAFPSRHGLSGRLPLVKAALHLTWDVVSFGVLTISSLYYRSLVL